MRQRTWKILDWGDVPENHPHTVPYTCRCGREAQLPVVGLVIAITGGHESELGDEAIIFDTCSRSGLPHEIQCRKCGRVFAFEVPADVR